MLRFNFAVIFTSALALLTINIASAAAQATPEQQSEFLQSTEAAIVENIGAQVESVELSIDGPIFTVLRVNSNLNASTHNGRNEEATAIVAVVSKALHSNPDYAAISVVHVEYVTREPPTSAAKQIDAIEFRKNQDGIFKINLT